MALSVSQLVYLATLAPSSHNLQPWLLTYHKSSHLLSLALNPHFDHHPSDPTNRQATISLGCLSYNLSYILDSYGLSAKPAYTYNLSRLATAKLVSPNHLTIIKTRQAYRGDYLPHSLPSVQISQLHKLNTNPTLTLHLQTDPASKLNLAELQSAANRAALLRPDFRRELAHSLLTSTSPTLRGLPGPTFGLSDQSTQKIISSLKAREFDGDFATGFANTDRDAIASSSLVAILCSTTDDPPAWFAIGILLESLWLKLTEFSLGVSIMAGLIESPSYRRQLQTFLHTPTYPQVVFRVGLPKLASWPRSPRIPISQILTLSD